jgi:hypothetical protein
MSSTLADKSRAPPRRGETKSVSTTKSKSIPEKDPSNDLLVLRTLGREIQSLSLMVEHKVLPVIYRGSSGPAVLAIPSLDYRYEATEASTVLRNTTRRLFGDKYYRIRLSTALNMSSSGAGVVNSVINASGAASLTDFTALSGIFNEFFVTSFDVMWEPASLYNGPVGYSPATTVSSLPLGCAQLQHFAAVYTTVSNMTENYDFRWNNTGRPFHTKWVNVERSNVDTVPETGAAGQGWQPVQFGSNYSGSLQFLSTVTPTLPVSAVLGTFFVSYDVLFRLRD